MSTSNWSKNIEVVQEERFKAINKGFTTEHDFKVNNKEQLTEIATLLLTRGIIRDCLLQEFSFEGVNVENWDNQVILKYLKLPYKDRVRIAAAMLVGELDRLDFINSNNINGNV